MKQCPQCDGRYADDSLNFCLQDGATLTFASDTPSSRNSDATLIYGSLDPGRGSMVVEPAQKQPPKFIAQPTLVHDARVAPANPGISSSHPTSRLLVGGVLAIAVLLLVSVGIGAALLFRQSRQTQIPASGPNAPNPNPASATSSPEGTSTTKGLSSGPGIESDQNSKTAPLKIKATASSVRYSVQSNTYDPSNAI
ncbi:MAG: hypothetical protein ND895_21895, partial [Pyrinomonadaceae bacterium]|nr:hypothetical protein [Pyrinomonadaceae bacterium]